MAIIKDIKAREIIDSRGNPTVECDIIFSDNSFGRAAVPSGASTGTYEAYEKRDVNDKRYFGKSVLKSVKLVNSKISKKLKNRNVHDQENIDALLINLDGTKQKKKSK